MPPAPPIFSTITGCPSVARRPSAITRPITSDDPPAPNGTTKVSGRVGQSCAVAGCTVAEVAAPARPAEQRMDRIREAFIPASSDATWVFAIVRMPQVLEARHDSDVDHFGLYPRSARSASATYERAPRRGAARRV